MHVYILFNRENFGYISPNWRDPPSKDPKFIRKRAMQIQITLQCGRFYVTFYMFTFLVIDIKVTFCGVLTLEVTTGLNLTCLISVKTFLVCLSSSIGDTTFQNFLLPYLATQMESRYNLLPVLLFIYELT